MNKSKIYITLVSFFIMIGAFSTPALAAKLPEAKPDKALIVFYRVKSFKGGAIPIGVHNSGGSIGTLSNGTSFQKYFEPGEYTFWSKVITENSVTLTVEAGKTYYVKGETRMGLVVARPKLTQTQTLESQ